jgi:hypothetical protein
MKTPPRTPTRTPAPSPGRGSLVGRIAGVAGLLGAGVLAAWLMAGHRQQHAASGPGRGELSPATPGAVVHPNVAPVAVSNPVPPWQATRASSPRVPQGQVPAWVVRPPAPDPDMHMPAAPVPPSDPQTTAAPMAAQ